MGTTQKYLMFISYIGSAFRGSQIQISKIYEIETVQSVLEKGFKDVFKGEGVRPFPVILSSRTDTGVHALRAASCINLPVYKNSFLPPKGLQGLMNNYFKDKQDLRILEVHAVPETFHLQRSCLSKTYMYRIGILKNEFYNELWDSVLPVTEIGRTELIRHKNLFDLNKTEEATHLFVGTKDYGAILGRPVRNTRPTICNIMSYTIERAQPFIQIDPISQKYDFYHLICKGDRFLYHMVRRMVGLTLSVGFNKLTLADIKKLFDEPVPSSWPRAFVRQVSGCGLYLANVDIDMQQMNQKDLSLNNTPEEVNPLSSKKLFSISNV